MGHAVMTLWSLTGIFHDYLLIFNSVKLFFTIIYVSIII